MKGIQKSTNKRSWSISKEWRNRQRPHSVCELTFPREPQVIKKEDNRSYPLFLSDPPGARTQDPNIKSVVLYLLS